MSLFDSLKDLGTKIFDVGELSVDNLVFKLHRIVTVVLLLAFSVVTSLGQVYFRRYIFIEMNHFTIDASRLRLRYKSNFIYDSTLVTLLSVSKETKQLTIS